MICMRPRLRRAGQRARREAGGQRVEGGATRRERPTTVETMCMTWLYRSMVKKSTTLTVPGAADPAQVVAAEVDEHDVLAALLGVGEQVLGQPDVVLVGVSPRGRVPAIGCMVTGPLPGR